MVDMHSHLIWDVDDGPKTWEEATELLKLASLDGIEQLIVTSHANHPQYHAEAVDVESKLNQLKHWLKETGIEIQLYSGHEARITESLVEDLKTGKVLPLAGSRYVLVEFPSATVPFFSKKMIKQLIDEGYFPIIAHPERNKVFAGDMRLLEELIDLGAYGQLTAGSLSGQFGKAIQKVSLKMLDAGLIHCYGSDVHNKNTRKFCFDKGLSYLENKNRQDFVEYLLENNERILENKFFLKIEPKESVLMSKFKFLIKK